VPQSSLSLLPPPSPIVACGLLLFSLCVCCAWCVPGTAYSTTWYIPNARGARGTARCDIRLFLYYQNYMRMNTFVHDCF